MNIILAVALIFSISMHVVIKRRAKKPKSTDYYGLYKEASKRLKQLTVEKNSGELVLSAYSDQLKWYRKFLEHAIIEYDMDEDTMYNLVRKTNDEFGVPTPTKKEMQDAAKKILESLGMHEELNQYKTQRNNIDDAPAPSNDIELTIDAILDKITKLGENSLTEQELKFLKNQ